MRTMNRFTPLLLLLAAVFVLSPINSSFALAQSARISDAAATAEVITAYANEDFAFIVKGANGEYSVATPRNISGRQLVGGVNTAYQMLKTNAEFQKMLEFYRESYKVRFEKQKEEFVKKIADTEAELKKREISKRMAESTIKYCRAEMQKIDSQKVPPLAIIVGQNPNETTSCMQPWSLEYKDAAGKTVSVPASILMQQATLEGISRDEDKLWSLVTLAHETGHMISDNTTGMRNINTDYRDPNPYFVVEDSMRSDSKVVEFTRKGDPMPTSHWFRKTTGSQTAFEEGFAEFTGSFFSAPGHDAYGIADDDYQATKMGYKVVRNGVEVKAELEWTDVLKSAAELRNTEFFIAKVLHRVAMSYADPYEGYRTILQVKSNPDFIKKPDLETFMRVFARENPQAYAKFKTDINKEINDIILKQTRNNNNRMDQVSELIAGIRNFLFLTGDAGVAERAARDHIAGGDTTSVQIGQKAPAQAIRTVKSPAGPVKGANIKQVNQKIGSGSLTK